MLHLLFLVLRIIVIEEDYLPSGDLSTAGFATEAVTNSLTSWDGDASRPSALLSCLQTERLDA